MDVKTGFAALALVLASGWPAAQAQVGSGSSQSLPSTGSSEQKTPQAPSTIQDGRSESLSSKLNKSDGVIKPTGDVDPAMKTPAPVPHPNSTPVIPPSATGGENAK